MRTKPNPRGPPHATAAVPQARRQGLCCTTSTAASARSGAVSLARRADHRLKLLAAQSAEGLAILDWFGLAPDHFDTWLFVDGAYACDDNDALLEVLRLLPGPGVTCATAAPAASLAARRVPRGATAQPLALVRPPAPTPSSSLLASRRA
ncbi:hypothetical protein P4112_01085 [Pseudomonas aeruginosa]|nr:hypothetical protein [Pseudomonas aeruginosa]